MGGRGGGVDGLGEVDKVTISSLVLFKMPKIRRVGVGGGEVLFIDLGLIEKFHFRFVGVLPAGGDRDVGVL